MKRATDILAYQTCYQHFGISNVLSTFGISNVLSTVWHIKCATDILSYQTWYRRFAISNLLSTLWHSNRAIDKQLGHLLYTFQETVASSQNRAAGVRLTLLPHEALFLPVMLTTPPVRHIVQHAVPAEAGNHRHSYGHQQTWRQSLTRDILLRINEFLTSSPKQLIYWKTGVFHFFPWLDIASGLRPPHCRGSAECLCLSFPWAQQ
jgi:hypothetical protein